VSVLYRNSGYILRANSDEKGNRMAETKPECDAGSILVTISHEEEIEADHADLFVTIRGASLFTGQAALTKAREVAQLVAALHTVGISDSEIRLQGVRADVTSGVLGKTSSATYSLKIRCSRLELLADTLGAITSQKNTSLQSLIWGYGDNEEQRLQWLDACIIRANAKAERIARGLGVRITGIVRFSEGNADPEANHVLTYDSLEPQMMSRYRTRSVSSDELGVEVSHSKTVTLTITVIYRVAPYETSPAS
jgi:uncharacterized protein YggE